MVQQKILISSSSKAIHNSFCRHIIKAISALNASQALDDLENIHKISFENEKLLLEGTDQSTIFHKAVYQSFDDKNFLNSDFWKSYKLLSFEILKKIKKDTGYLGEWAIQRFPTMRFQFPNNISVFEFHRDSNYSHPLGEINCFYAINKCIDSSALQVEKNLGFEDYIPLNLNPGEYAILNTSIYKHGDILNITKKTRISMDFRFIPKAQLKKGASSLTKGIKFNTESYFMDEKEISSYY